MRESVGRFEIDDVLLHATLDVVSKMYTGGNGRVYSVKMNSLRYQTFLKGLSCSMCGLTGRYFLLDVDDGNPESRAHFNLYAEEDGERVLMTKDHIIPKAKGGTDRFENLVTACTRCNELKGTLVDFHIEHLLYARRVWREMGSPSIAKRLFEAMCSLRKLRIEGLKIDPEILEMLAL